MKEKTIVLPVDLSERRELLEAELSEVVEAQAVAYLQRNFKEELNLAGFTEGTATITWDFYPEGDDEGGTDYWPTGVSLSVNGEYIEMSEVDYEKTYKYSGGGSYHPDLEDQLRDILCGNTSDLYDQDILEVTVTLH